MVGVFKAIKISIIIYIYNENSQLYDGIYSSNRNRNVI